MENIISQRFIDIKDLPTTTVEIIAASHTEPDYIVAQIEYAVFDIVTGAPTMETITLTKTDVMAYKTFLQNERARLAARFDNLNAFLAVAGPLVEQWLIDHPSEEPQPE